MGGLLEFTAQKTMQTVQHVHARNTHTNRLSIPLPPPQLRRTRDRGGGAGRVLDMSLCICTFAQAPQPGFCKPLSSLPRLGFFSQAMGGSAERYLF